MGDVEQARPLSHSLVFFDYPGILNWELPSAEVYKLALVFYVHIMQRRFQQLGHWHTS